MRRRRHGLGLWALVIMLAPVLLAVAVAMVVTLAAMVDAITTLTGM